MTRRRLAGRGVGPIGMGTARLAISDPLDEKDAFDLLNHAVDLGFEYFDTALAYTTAEDANYAESLVARVLSHRRDEVLVGTKGGHYRSGSQWLVDARPSSLRRHCEASLRALSVDSIDLYYLHFPDPAVPFEESVGALDDLRREGKIRAIGVCNVSVEQLHTAIKVAPIAAVQNLFSPFNSRSRDVLTVCESRGVTFTAASPLGGARPPMPLKQLSPTAASLAQQLGVGIGTVWLAWMLRLSHTIIPVTGARRTESLEASWASTSLALTDGQCDVIESELTLETNKKG